MAEYKHSNSRYGICFLHGTEVKNQCSKWTSLLDHSHCSTPTHIFIPLISSQHPLCAFFYPPRVCLIPLHFHSTKFCTQPWSTQCLKASSSLLLQLNLFMTYTWYIEEESTWYCTKQWTRLQSVCFVSSPAQSMSHIFISISNDGHSCNQRL